MTGTFYWHDYETWGTDPRLDRPAQFAGLRTDWDLNPMGEPLVVYCRPADDLLPDPESCLITGLTPQRALSQGLPEAHFFARIHAELAQPLTCGAGYNSMRFDDEVTRFGLWRNFFDPYAREWQNDNSRWDLIDVLRMAHALRPDGLDWPLHDNGHASFRLEDLCAANGIPHGTAHEALADVRATLSLARRLRERQPRLFDFALQLRDKRQARALLEPLQPVLHVSAKYPAELGCIAPVLPLASHPGNPNGVLVYDLRVAPEPLLELEVAAIQERLFRPRRTPPEGEAPVERIPLKQVRLNHAPMLAPLKTLGKQAAARWRIDLAQIQRHADQLKAARGLPDKLRQVFAAPESGPPQDPDQDLYGGFLNARDRALVAQVRRTPPGALGDARFPFQDPRLAPLLFRYRARNWPETLSAEERHQWDQERRRRLTGAEGGGRTLDGYRARVRELRETRADPLALGVLEELLAWADRIDPGPA